MGFINQFNEFIYYYMSSYRDNKIDEMVKVLKEDLKNVKLYYQSI